MDALPRHRPFRDRNSRGWERGRSEGSDHGDKVLNQILSLMSDLEKSNDDVFVIATTNKLETIDNAVKLSVRFGKQIEVLEPDKKGLSAIFDVHTRNKSLLSRASCRSFEI